LSSEYIQFRILYILYDKIESEGNSRDIRVDELINDPELNYLDPKTVSIEIEFLAGKNFILGSSRTGQSPFQYVKILSEGIGIIRHVMKDYPLTLRDNADKEYKQKYNQISATQNLKGKRLEIFGWIKDHVGDFEDYLEKTNAISVNPIPYSPTKPQVGNTYNIHTGNVFQNIENSTIVNDSSIKNAFNKLGSDKETGESLMEIAEFIDKSGNLGAGAIFDGFVGELNKEKPDKSRLEKFWSGIETVLPTVTSVSNAASKIISLFT
jgi:hypothetical protein